MTRPLELTIHPLIQDRHGEDWYVWKDTAVRPFVADMYAVNKHLTEPELAAEYWQSDYADTRYDREDEDLEPIPEIIQRFATLPHYDEAGE